MGEAPLTELADFLARGGQFSQDEAEAATSRLLAADADPAQVGDFLAALAKRGHDAPTIAGAVRAVRASAIPVPWHWPAVDVVGTGGDGSDSLNISTIAGLMAASAGATVAKTGNRAATSRCGSADVLEQLGLTIDDVDLIPAQLRDLGFGFVSSAVVHPAVGRLAPVRRQLGVRTLFNLVGPLASPIDLSGRLIGAAEAADQETMAEAAGMLGFRRTWVVHGHGGLDELTTTGPSRVIEVDGATVRELTVDPAALCLQPATRDDLRGGDAAQNARAIAELAAGRADRPLRDTCLLNAAAVLHLAGLAADLPAGVDLATAALDSGAMARLVQSMGAPRPGRSDTSEPSDTSTPSEGAPTRAS